MIWVKNKLISNRADIFFTPSRSNRITHDERFSFGDEGNQA